MTSVSPGIDCADDAVASGASASKAQMDAGNLFDFHRFAVVFIGIRMTPTPKLTASSPDSGHDDGRGRAPHAFEMETPPGTTAGKARGSQGRAHSHG